MPESAYWLLLHDRPQEARKSLSRLHGNEALADSEFERLQGEVMKAKQLQALKGGKKDRMAFLRCLSGTNKVRYSVSLCPHFYGIHVAETNHDVVQKRTFAAVATTVGQQLCGASVVLGCTFEPHYHLPETHAVRHSSILGNPQMYHISSITFTLKMFSLLPPSSSRSSSSELHLRSSLWRSMVAGGLFFLELPSWPLLSL